MPGFKDQRDNLFRRFLGESAEDKAKSQEAIPSSSAGKTPEENIKTLLDSRLTALHASLGRLEEGTFSSDDISLLQEALASKKITIASRGGVGIEGNVIGGTITTSYHEGDNINTTFTLPAEALKLLEPKKTYQIPYPTNTNFTGRGSLLTDLQSALKSGNVVLTGLGGIGKTQLALKYSYRYQDDYDIVWWLRSEQSFTLLEDYARLAWELGLAGEDVKDQELLAGKVRGFLESHNRWLLVFDNAQDPQDLKPYLPHGGAGHVIITSRNPVWGNLARPLEVSKFERPESIEFLLKRTRQEDRKAADDLGEALGDLPLALEQAGAYMETTGKPLGEYLKAFQDRRLKMLARSKPSDYPETVATTWKISVEAVEKDQPAAVELLRLFSYLAPDDIPLEYLIKGSGQLPDNVASVLNDEDGRDEALAALRRYSLVNMGSGKISVHRLIQAVTRDDLAPQEQKDWAGAAVKLLNYMFPNDHIDTWGKCSVLLPHALAAAEQAEDLGVEPEATWRLLNESGLYLRTPLGQFSAARSALERALKIAEAVYGPNHAYVARILNDIGEVLNALGDLKGAIKCHEKALEIREKVLGPDHPDVAWSLNNIGVVLRQQGNPRGAKEYHEKALKIWEKAHHGPERRHVAWALNNIGLALKDLGDLKGAMEHLERALEIKKKVYVPDSPDVSMSLNDIGEVLYTKGDLKGAMKYHEEALEIREKVLGPDHPDVAWSLINIGMILQSLDDYGSARKRYERALKICRAKLGPDHPSTRLVENNLNSLRHG